jgi:hypothetical protein
MATKTLRRVRVFHNRRGKPVEVLLPFDLFEEMRDAYVGRAIYNGAEVQKGLRQARHDIARGGVHTFKTLREMFAWLDSD